MGLAPGRSGRRRWRGGGGRRWRRWRRRWRRRRWRWRRRGGGGGPHGHPRKDRFLVPINTDFDLYSMGRDGQSVAPLTAAKSRDDVVRAANGAYIGLASNF